MNKNTIIGLVCIGAIFFGFTWYTQKQSADYQKEQHRLDSIALANAPAQPVSSTGQNLEAGASTPDTAAAKENFAKPVVSLGTYLDQARNGQEEHYKLENKRIALTFSNRGGRVASAELKGYYTYKKKPLMLFEEQTIGSDGLQTSGARFNLNLFAPQQINTADFYFTHTATTDSTIAFRLYADSLSYLEYTYTLQPDNYMVGFRIDLSHFKGVLLPNQPDVTAAWSIISPQQEKGFQNENTYTTIAYHYPSESTIEELGTSTDQKSEELKTKIQWVAFKQQFFSSILLAENNFSNANIAFNTFPETASNIKEFSALVTLPYNPTVEGYNLKFYFGPNKYSILKKYDGTEFQKLVPLGWWIIGWVNRWLVIPVFDFLGSHIASFGLVILLLTILLKLLIFPLTYKSYLSTAKMRLLKPDIDKVNERFPKKEDALKKQQAVMQVYKSAGVSPMGGCLPMLIQLPILIAMFRFFPASIELRGEAFLWADDLSAYDSIWTFPNSFSLPFYGDHISLFTVLMAVSLFFTSKINYAQSAGMSQQQMPGMKFMMLYMMPVMLLLWFNNYSAGLSYYYLLSNLITMGQTYAFRYLVDDKKLHAQMQANSTKPVKKSKWQERLENMQKQQQQQLKNRKK